MVKYKDRESPSRESGTDRRRRSDEYKSPNTKSDPRHRDSSAEKTTGSRRKRDEGRSPKGSIKTSINVQKDEQNKASSSRRRTDSSSMISSSSRRASPDDRRRYNTSRKRRRSTSSEPSSSSSRDPRRIRWHSRSRSRSSSARRRTASSRRSRREESADESVEEEVIGIDTTELLGGDGLVKAPPTFYELKEGFTIQHRHGGPFCGGYAHQESLKTLTKLTEKIDFYKKVPNQSEIVTYLFNEKAFKNAILSGSNDESDMYTMIAVFSNKMTKDDAILSEMKSKEDHFTSFVHFLDEFQKKKFPEWKMLLIREAEMCVQEDEPFMNYAQRWELLVKQAGWDLEQRLSQFISGMLNIETQKECNRQAFAVRNFETIRTYAAELESREKELKINTARRERDKEIAKSMKRSKLTSTVASVSTSGKKPASSSASSKSSGPKSASKHVATVTNPMPISPVVNAKLQADLPKAMKEIKQMNLRGCFACLQDHNFNGNFEHCGNSCVFCKKAFAPNGPRHLAWSCHKRPKEKRDITNALNAFRDGQRRQK